MAASRARVVTGLLALGLALVGAAPALAGVGGSAAGSLDRALEAGTGNIEAGSCSYRGIALHGKVKVVESFADIRIKAVSSFPDLKVKRVNSFADDCGEWQFVDSFPDFTVQYVDSFPDLEIAWVESFPGLP